MRSAWQIDPDDVQLKQILDAGAFGEVCGGRTFVKHTWRNKKHLI